jgi:putative membrane protein
MTRDRPRQGRAPAAYRLDDPSVQTMALPEIEELDPVQHDAHEAVEGLVQPKRRGLRLGRLLVASGGILLSLAAGLWLESLVRNLFVRADWLGWTGIALVGIFLLALLGVIGREIAGIFRLRKMAHLRLAADAVIERNDTKAAQWLARDLIALYSGRVDTARGRNRLAGHLPEVIDGRDLVMLAERDLMAPLDKEARRLVTQAAKRVSVVTAVSPRAFVDVAFVLWEGVRLIRRLAALYGGRPGFFGLLRLMRAVLAHLAVTGSIAAGETLFQQVIGQGLAARLSARLGEGVVNGLMTARIGLSAMDVSRPLPFLAGDRPKLADLTSELVSWNSRKTVEDESLSG